MRNYCFENVVRCLRIDKKHVETIGVLLEMSRRKCRDGEPLNCITKQVSNTRLIGSKKNAWFDSIHCIICSETHSI